MKGPVLYPDTADLSPHETETQNQAQLFRKPDNRCHGSYKAMNNSSLFHMTSPRNIMQHYLHFDTSIHL